MPEVTGELRTKLLRGTAAEFGSESDGGVWGVLMETGYPQAAVTLVALADGTASIYFSTGGGMIGGGPHPSVNAAARGLVHRAAGHLSAMPPVSDFPYPATGRVIFYVLTTDGVLAAEAAEETLGEGNHHLSELFFAGHEVIARLREISEEQGR